MKATLIVNQSIRDLPDGRSNVKVEIEGIEAHLAKKLIGYVYTLLASCKDSSSPLIIRYNTYDSDGNLKQGG